MARRLTTDGKELKYVLSDEKQAELIAALLEHNFNITKATNAIGIVRETYYYALRWQPEFLEKITWSQHFINNIILNGVLEGLTHQDLTLRHKYLDLLSKSGVLAKAMGFETDKQEVTLQFDKSQIKLG